MGKDTELLIIIDRDGTLITDTDFPGRNKDWKKDVAVNAGVASFLYNLQKKFRTVTVVVSNQSGVARGFFTEHTVNEINRHIAQELKKYNVTVDSWQFCPYVDTAYARAHPEYRIKPEYIQEVTKRKPATVMIKDALSGLGKKPEDSEMLLVLGDRDEDSQLATNLGAVYIDVKGKSETQMTGEFGSYTGIGRKNRY